MASPRDHIEMQSPYSGDQVAEEQQQLPTGLHFRVKWTRRPEVKILAAVISVGLLAIIGTVAVLEIGGSPSDMSEFREEAAMLGDPVFAPAAAVLRSEELINEHTPKNSLSPHHSVKDRTSKDFDQVEEPLEHVRSHSHSDSSRGSSVSHKEKEPVQPAVGYDLVEEPVEKVKEHDYRERHNSHNSANTVELPQRTEGKTESHNEIRYSTRLASSKNGKDIPVCETPECAIEAVALVESMDLSIDPCEDFYTFACGGFIEKHPIEEGGSTGTFIEAAETIDKRLHLVLQQPAAPDAPKPLHMTKDHYQACMDTDTIDALGVEPLIPHLNEAGLGGWPMSMDDWDVDKFQLESAMANLRLINKHALFTLGVDANFKDTSEFIIYADAGNVPLGHTLMANLPENLKADYKVLMLDMAKLVRDYLGSSVTEEEMHVQIDEVIDFEIKFSKLVNADVPHGQSPDDMYFTYLAYLQSQIDVAGLGVFSWLNYLQEMFIRTDVIIDESERIITFEGPFYQDVAKLIAEVGPRTLANHIAWYWVYDLGNESFHTMRELLREFHGKLVGEEQDDVRSNHCMLEVNYNLGFALARDYVDEFFPTTAKKEIEEMIEDIRSSFMSLLDENTWMLPEDLEVAREKLTAIDPFAAYPDWIMDDQLFTDGFEGLHIESGTLVENIYSIGKWQDFHSLASIRDKPEHTFLMPPTIVNAFYNPQQNTITILAGILQRPFYAHNSLAAINYGGIGMVIGHEMTHGFDNMGRLFDKDGNLVHWWSDETIIGFNKRAQCFTEQYNKYIPPELIAVGRNDSVDGYQTLGENIADNGGIREASRAYQLYVERYGEEPRLPGLDEFTPEHLFYLSHAQVWCEHKSPESLLVQMAIDPHSPGRFRVIGPLSNDQEFSKVWNCPAESAMNKGEDSCLLW